jgi:hypothetical protein
MHFFQEPHDSKVLPWVGSLIYSLFSVKMTRVLDSCYFILGLDIGSDRKETTEIRSNLSRPSQL